MKQKSINLFMFLGIVVLLAACRASAASSRVDNINATRETRLAMALTPTVPSEESSDSMDTPVDISVDMPGAITDDNVPVEGRVLVPTPAKSIDAPALAPPTVAPIHQPAVPRVELTGFNHQWQTWNNCGPATLSMNLSYYGSPLTQADIGAVLRRHEDDKNVSPEEMVAFAQSQGFYGQLRVNGNAELMRLLLSNGVPVIIETWLEEEPNDGLGHYRMLTGYDDAEQYWIGYDSYVDTGLFSSLRTYRGIRMAYAETEELWSVFNHTYLLIYTEAQRPTIESIFGASLDPGMMWQEALIDAQQTVSAQPNNAFAWFNLGTNLTTLGKHTAAADAYDRARAFGLPWRMLWYQFGPFQAYHAIGRYQDVVSLADATLVNTQSVEELHYWRGMGLASLGNGNAAQQAWRQALQLNPDYRPAQDALAGR